MPERRPSVKNERQYQALRDKKDVKGALGEDRQLPGSFQAGRKEIGLGRR
jgi:hypothetical protein